MEGIADIFDGQHLLKDGHIVEVRGINRDTQHRIAGWGSHRHAEQRIGVVQTESLVTEAGHTHHQRG